MLAPRFLLLPERTIPRFTCPCSIESSPGALRPYRERCCRAVGRSAGFPGLSRPGVLLSGRALTLWSRGSKPRDMAGNSENRCLISKSRSWASSPKVRKSQLCGSVMSCAKSDCGAGRVRSKLATAFPCRQGRPASI
jgi:hypothetical protein